MPKKIFINAPLSTLAEQKLNREIADIVKKVGFEIYFPQEVIPPGPNVSAKKVYEANMQAINDCDILLSIMDKPGTGVVFELGYAIAIKKPIILFRSDEQDYLGKVIEGLWEKHDSKNKARNLSELEKILKSY